jgi:4-cresol dehydrogenase (hydroxylating)
VNERVQQATDAWTQLLGPKSVTTDPELLAALGANATGFAPRAVVAELHPTSTDQIPAIVHTARRYGVPIYPYSTGRNWGLGSRLPPRPGCALVSLRRLDRIREIDVRQHYAIVEPGVTQEQLADRLRDDLLPAVLNVTGSSPRSSVVGNLLERGTGFHNHRVDDLRGLEVVLGTGEKIRTGFWGTGAGPRSRHHYRQGLGPYLDGLFTQSNLGVVTAAVVNLVPAQEETSTIVFSFTGTLVAEMIEELAELYREGVLRQITHMFNDKRLLTLRGASTVPTWTGVTAVSGRRDFTALAADLIASHLGRLGASVSVISPRDEVDPFLAGLRDVHLGRPTEMFMRGVHEVLGGTSEGIDLDELDASPVGMLVCNPFLPLEAAPVLEAMDIIERTCEDRTVVPAIAINPVDGNALEMVVNIYFDRTAPHEAAAAHACNALLHERLYGAGFRFYRVDIENMSFLLSRETAGWSVVSKLKAALDPDGIISPGRYSMS